MELIDRQAAIDALRRDPMGGLNYERILKNMPTAEPKRARWVNVNEGKWNTIEVLKCTACGEIDNRMYRTDGYCPNCGAKMGGDAK